MAIGEEDVRRLVQLYELRDEVEQAIVLSENRLAAIQREISNAEKQFHAIVWPTQTLRVFHFQGGDLIVQLDEGWTRQLSCVNARVLATRDSPLVSAVRLNLLADRLTRDGHISKFLCVVSGAWPIAGRRRCDGINQSADGATRQEERPC